MAINLAFYWKKEKEVNLLLKKYCVGNKIIFDYLNGKGEHNESGLLTRLGVIIQDNKDNTYHVMYFDDYNIHIAYNIIPNFILPIENVEFERTRIITKYEKLISREKEKLKTVSQEEKDKQKSERYESIKQRIIKNCEWCIDRDLDDEDFVNRVKEIANLKKQLFSPEKLPCISEVHKYNGTIKYNIRQLEQERYKLLKQISDEEIELRFRKF